MIIGLIFLILVFSFILIKSADLVIIAIRRISKNLHTGVFSISAIILALGTSFPELFVGLTSAIENSPNLSLGVVLGSNIANIALVAGFSAFLTGRVRVHGSYLKYDIWVALIAGFLPILLIFDQTLSRVDGLILLSVYLAYATGFFRRRYVQIGQEQAEEGFVYRFLRKFNHPINGREAKEFGRLFAGIALLLFSADAVVNLSQKLAENANIPVFLVGLFVLAVGTSLPELAFSFRSLKDREPSMFFGNLLGSTIANSTLVIGAAAVISPIRIIAVNEYLMATIAFSLIFLSFWYFIRTKHRLERWEAFILMSFYIAFIVAEFI